MTFFMLLAYRMTEYGAFAPKDDRYVILVIVMALFWLLTQKWVPKQDKLIMKVETDKMDKENNA